MRVAVFALATVSLLCGVSAYADSMSLPALAVGGASAAPLARIESPLTGDGTATQLLDVQTTPPAAVPVTPTAVTPEPSSIVLMATGLIGVSGMLWRRRSLTR